MPTYQFTSTFAISSNPSTQASQPGISPAQINFNNSFIGYVNNDSEVGNMTLAANQNQRLYQPAGTAAQLPDLTYVYVAASSANSSSVSLLYTSGSSTTTIAKLLPGAWMFIPMKVVSGSGASEASTSINLVNDSGTYSAALYTIFAESGSVAI